MGYSEGIIFEFIYLPSGFFQGVENVHSEEFENNILFTWSPLSSKKEEYECIGTNIYKDGDLLMYVPIPDTSFIYENPPPGYYTYCLTRVYTEDGGEHSWDSDIEENCIYDAGYPEECNPPRNLVASYINGNPLNTKLQWSPPELSKHASKELLGYYIYRDGELITPDYIIDTIYELTSDITYTCYLVSAKYSSCGQSEGSNEACIEGSSGVNDLQKKVTLYPNPATTSINIESNQQIKNIKLLNQRGQTLKINKDLNVQNYQFDISEYKNGIYFLEIEDEQGILNKKLIIQK